ncbi:MAG: hypothetical protein ACHQSE_03440 [Gemmatimonadales bacterium]
MEEPNQGTAANRSGAPSKVSFRRKAAIGCFTAWLGFVSGAMVAALLSKLAAFVTRAPECAEVPSCNWYIWAAAGGAIGAVTLPVLVLWVLGKPAKAGARKSEF